MTLTSLCAGRLVVSILLFIFVSVWLVDHVSTAPFVLVALLGVVLCLFQFRRSARTSAKILWLNVGTVVLLLGVVEVTLWLVTVPPSDFVKGFSPGAGFVNDQYFGYGPLAPSRTHVIKQYDGKTIYDVVYTIDDKGLRISPPELEPSRRRGCVLFFGCSNTFGEGVADDETMPWQVGIKTGGRYAVRNMGFQGWGPHQMLSALESGEAERVVGCEVTDVVYLALYWHALRVAGRVPWDTDGPRYVLDSSGRAVRAGYFSDVTRVGPLRRSVLDRLKKSYVYRRYLAARLDPYERPTNHRDLDLFGAVLDRSHEEVARRFPRAAFHVLFWDIGLWPQAVSDFVRRVAKPGVDLRMLSEAIPDYRVPYDARYRMPPGDFHPSPAAYALIADYVATKVLHDAPP